jgi:hypothetical protein
VAEVVPPDADGLSISALRTRRTEWKAAIVQFARTADADWDGQPLDEFIADLTAGRDAAGGTEEFGWFSYGAVGLRVRIRVEASTASAASSAAIDRLQLPPGWRAKWTARPNRGPSYAATAAEATPCFLGREVARR